MDREALDRLLASLKEPAVDAPLLRDHSGVVLATLGKETRRTYASALRLLNDGWHVDRCQRAGVAAVAEPLGLVVGPSVILYPGLGECRLTQVFESDVRLAATWARAHALHRGAVHNRGRAERGLPPLAHTGNGAAETLLSATSCVYRRAAGDRLIPSGFNPAAGIRKPRRGRPRRRVMTPTETYEVQAVTAAGGRDPELDAVLFVCTLRPGRASRARSTCRFGI